VEQDRTILAGVLYLMYEKKGMQRQRDVKERRLHRSEKMAAEVKRNGHSGNNQTSSVVRVKYWGKIN